MATFKDRGQRPTSRVWRKGFGINWKTGKQFDVKMTAIKWPKKGFTKIKKWK